MMRGWRGHWGAEVTGERWEIAARKCWVAGFEQEDAEDQEDGLGRWVCWERGWVVDRGTGETPVSLLALDFALGLHLGGEFLLVGFFGGEVFAGAFAEVDEAEGAAGAGGGLSCRRRGGW